MMVVRGNHFGGLAHLVERLFCKQKVKGSSPLLSTHSVKGEQVATVHRVTMFSQFALHFESKQQKTQVMPNAGSCEKRAYGHVVNWCITLC